MGVGVSLLIFAVGAILKFAVTVNTTGFNVNTAGVILMIVGAVGFAVSLLFWASWGGFGTYHRTRRVHHDSTGTGPGGGTGTVVDDRTDTFS